MEPENHHFPEKDETIQVAAAVIQDRGKYLVCRRAPGKRHAGLWEFPGGKAGTGENVEQALVRELDEELGTRPVRVGPRLFAAKDRASGFEIVFVAAKIDRPPRLLEHSDMGWFCLKDLVRLDLAPADRRFVESCLIQVP